MCAKPGLICETIPEITKLMRPGEEWIPPRDLSFWEHNLP
jgi:hypothetical protein